METQLIRTEVLLLLVTITAWGALVVPTPWSPNARLVGETLMAVALPESAMNCGFNDALSIRVIKPV